MTIKQDYTLKGLLITYVSLLILLNITDYLKIIPQRIFPNLTGAILQNLLFVAIAMGVWLLIIYGLIRLGAQYGVLK